MQQTDYQYLNSTAILDSDHPQELPFLGSDYTGFVPLCASQNQPLEVIYTSREANREGSGDEGGGYGRGDVKAVSYKKWRKLRKFV